MKLFGGGLVVRTLKRFGVQHIFSLPGHQTLSIFDACQSQHLDLVSTRHEASAVYMAQALSLAERTPGVAVLAGGPELTNALTGIAQAYYSHTPVVVISGSNTYQKRDRGFPQDMDQLQVVRPFTKWARSCHAVERIPEYIEAAFRHAIRGRPGPTYVEIPYDVMETRLAVKDADLPERPALLRPGAEPGLLEKLAGLLREAQRPVIIAGSGVFWSGAEAELAALAHRTRVPLFLSNAALAAPFPNQDCFGIGSPGSGRPSLRAITEADLILLIGTEMNWLLGFGKQPFISPRQKVAHIDIEPEEIGANRAVDLAIAGDPKTVLLAFNSRDLPAPSPAIQAWHSRLESEAVRFDRKIAGLGKNDGVPIHPMRLVRELEAVRASDSYLVLDGANSILWALMGFKPREQGGVILSTMGELQAIGAGLPHALALKRAFPERQVILHTGDGSLGYGMMELETAVRYGIPLVVVVHNDSGWGMTRDMQSQFFGQRSRIGEELGIVHYERMVEALGGHGEFVERPDDIRPAIQRAIASGVPACVNVMVDGRPQSPGLKTFMLMEVMLGKPTAYDNIPVWMRRLQAAGLDRAARTGLLRYLDRTLHRDM